MHKIIFIFISSLFSFTLYAQVGINTTDPQETLHVKGSVRIQDGSEGTDKVLTSDADGTGTWKQSKISNIIGVLGAGVDVPYNTSAYLQTGTSITLPPGKYVVNVSMLLTQTSGRAVNDSNFWLRSSFSDSNVGVGISGDIVNGGNLISGNHIPSAIYSILSGFVFINNSTAVDKTYYYIVGNCTTFNTTATINSFGGTTWAENNIVAYRID